MNRNQTVSILTASLGLSLLGVLAAPLAQTPTLALSAVSSPAPEATWNRTELYFGAGKPDGSSVTDKEFAAFVDKEITPRFPDGLTLLTGYGQFRGQSGRIIKEKSFVLVLLTEKTAKDANAKIETIRKLYKGAFKQESVLRVDEPIRVSF